MDLNAKQHRQSATIPPSPEHPAGRFPMPDAEHARLALSMLGRAKGLSSNQKAEIRSRAMAMLRGQHSGSTQD